MNHFFSSCILQVGQWFGCLEKWVLVALVIFLTGFGLLQIILRNFFATGFVWGDTLLRHVVLWVGILGAARATSEDRHIHIDLLHWLFPEAVKSVITLCSHVFEVIVSAVLTYASWHFVQNERMAGGFAFGSIPSWWLELIFPFGFALMTVRFGWRLIESLASLSHEAKE